MSSYIFDGVIDVESVTDLLEAIKDGARTIYMSSTGGNISMIDIFGRELVALSSLVVLIIALGFYP